MRVSIAGPVFQSTSLFDALDRMLDHFVSGRHQWEIDDVDVIKNSLWLATNDRISKRNTEILEKCFVAAAHARPGLMHSMQIAVDLATVMPDRLSPADAVTYLSAPTIVIIENEESDGAFLDAMLNAYGRVDIWLAKENRWLEYDHAGGYGEIEKRIERYRARTPGPSRLFVVTDSDRLFPGHQSETFEQVADVCTRHNVPYAILAKRSIENYLPVGALQRSARRNCYQAFLKLNATQRDHFSMKKGFTRDESGTVVVSPEQAALFQHLPRKVLDELCGGFGKEIWKLFETAVEVITADTMNLTCSNDRQELPDLFDRIEALL